MSKKILNERTLQYNVFYHNFNSKKIEVFNIFEHSRFLNDVKRDLKKYDNKDEFEKALKGTLFYYYCSKCEWEVVITSWVPRISIQELDRVNQELENTLKKYGCKPYSMYMSPDVSEKVDVYEQVMLNWDLFLNYVWSYKDKK